MVSGAEVRPIDLVRLRRAACADAGTPPLPAVAQRRDQGTEVIDGAGITALAHHRKESRGAYRGVLGKGVDEKHPIRLDQ